MKIDRLSGGARLSGNLSTSPLDCRRGGLALIWTAILMMLFIGFVGLAIDWALVSLVAHQLQNAADASALAAAQQVRDDAAAARLAARDLALANNAAGGPVQLELNEENDPAGDVVVGRFDRQSGLFSATLFSPNAVKVVARRTEESLGGALPLLFGPVFGAETSQVAREAIAMIGGGTGAGLITLNESAGCSLQLKGTVTLSVDGGDMQINSDSSSALCANGTPTIQAPAINVAGNIQVTRNVSFDGEVNTYMPRIADPLAHLPAPSWDPDAGFPAVNVTGGQTVNLSPGYYPGGISINNGTLNLAPGIYVVDGPGLAVSGNANFIAEGVMIYLKGGPLDLRGTGITRITPPDPDNPEIVYPSPEALEEAATYEGVSIFQARDNTSLSKIRGTSSLDLNGTLYFPANKLYVTGTSDKVGNQLIADKLEIDGTGSIVINYDGRFPSPGTRVFLVR
jgi:hypothetical protein